MTGGAKGVECSTPRALAREAAFRKLTVHAFNDGAGGTLFELTVDIPNRWDATRALFASIVLAAWLLAARYGRAMAFTITRVAPNNSSFPRADPNHSTSGRILSIACLADPNRIYAGSVASLALE
jgi:hypothetical protein